MGEGEGAVGQMGLAVRGDGGWDGVDNGGAGVDAGAGAQVMFFWLGRWRVSVERLKWVCRADTPLAVLEGLSSGAVEGAASGASLDAAMDTSFPTPREACSSVCSVSLFVSGCTAPSSGRGMPGESPMWVQYTIFRFPRNLFCKACMKTCVYMSGNDEFTGFVVSQMG